VVQEVVMAKQAILVYGPYSIPFDGVLIGRKAIQDIVSKETNTQALEVVSVLDSMVAIYGLGFNKCEPATFMAEARYSRTSNAHDNLYAAYGLLSKQGLNLPQPSYGRPVAEIYREATMEL
jgi:hypothetical protein